MKRYAQVVAGLGALFLSTGAGKDNEKGSELENVSVMDSKMSLSDARRYMLTFNDALGVQCRDCHNLKDFASDEKPLKLAARDMMRMEKDLNAKWFPAREKPVVTCWTCHRGRRTPAAATDRPSLLTSSEDSSTAASPSGD